MLVHIKDDRDCYTVVLRNKSFCFNSTHCQYNDLVAAVKEGDEEKFLDRWNTKDLIESWSSGDFRIGNGVLWYRDEVINDVITERVISMIREKFNCQPMLRFLENLYQNPSFRACQELYSFLRHRFLPITSDGCFLAYKAVTSEYKDKYSEKIDNHPGSIVEMPRFRVDDNCNQGCGQGLHVGAIDYVRSYGRYGDKVVICKVNPADVVSVPLDSEQQKLRCCRYEVVAEYDGEIFEPVKDYDEEEQDSSLKSEWLTDEDNQ